MSQFRRRQEQPRPCGPSGRKPHGLPGLEVVVALGKIAFDAYLSILHSKGLIASRAVYKFGHAAMYHFPAPLPTLIASYHPSRQNTQTGKLTGTMFQKVFQKAARNLENYSR